MCIRDSLEIAELDAAMLKLNDIDEEASMLIDEAASMMFQAKVQSKWYHMFDDLLGMWWCARLSHCNNTSKVIKDARLRIFNKSSDKGRPSLE